MGKKLSKKLKITEGGQYEEFHKDVPATSGGVSSKSAEKGPKEEVAYRHEGLGGANKADADMLEELFAEDEQQQASAQGQPSRAKLVRQSPVEKPEPSQK